MFAGFSTLYKPAQKANCRRLATLFPPPTPTSGPTSAPSEVAFDLLFVRPLVAADHFSLADIFASAAC
jgi:hypothetical protein